MEAEKRISGKVKRCPFCNKNNLGKHEIIHEDENHLVFFSKEPVNPGHTLVIPKRHAKSILSLTDKETDRLFELVKRAAKTIHKSLKPEGLDIGTNYGRKAGQTVDHLHVHIVPRYTGDFNFLQIISKKNAPYGKILENENIELADKVRKAWLL